MLMKRLILALSVILVGTSLLPKPVVAACQSCFLSLDCVNDPYGQTQCRPWTEEEGRCETGGSHCAFFLGASTAVAISADGSLALRERAGAAASNTAVEESYVKRNCGGVITSRHYSVDDAERIRALTGDLLL